MTESLAGRAVILEVWPFSEVEMAGGGGAFVDVAATDPERLRSGGASLWTRQDYFEAICRGGYPEAIPIRGRRARDAWFRTYVQSIVDTDIREMARVDEPSHLQRLLAYAAATTGQEFNDAKAANNLSIHRTTVRRYLGLLETVFLVRSLPAWSRNITSRATKRAKLHITDSGLAAHLLGIDASGLAARICPARGPLVESFVVNEIVKQASWSDVEASLSHWRVSQGAEVDLVLELTNGKVIGIEVKATDAVGLSDFRGLTDLRDRLGSDFVQGFVFCTGPHRLSFGDRLTALPISALWE